MIENQMELKVSEKKQIIFKCPAADLEVTLKIKAPFATAGVQLHRVAAIISCLVVVLMMMMMMTTDGGLSSLLHKHTCHYCHTR